MVLSRSYSSLDNDRSLRVNPFPFSFRVFSVFRGRLFLLFRRSGQHHDRSKWKALASDGDLDLLSLNGQRQTAFRPHFQALSYSFSGIRPRLFTTRSLADTTGDRWTFSDPDAILITIQRGQKLHAWDFTSWSSPSNRIRAVFACLACFAGNPSSGLSVDANRAERCPEWQSPNPVRAARLLPSPH
jgi:hypothetical protein